jgi:hypothetical protein
VHCGWRRADLTGVEPAAGAVVSGRRESARTRAEPARAWTVLLVLLGAGLCALDVGAVHPGYLSSDSVQQLGQALDPSTTTDWHPPVMTALWGLLLGLTGGSVGSMVALQLGLLWASLTALAVYVHRVSGRRALSLLPLVLGTLPHVTAVSGVVWKDAQLAVALLAAVVLLLFVRRGIDRVWLRWVVVAAVVLLLAYAGAVRYNALPAVVPLLLLLTWPGGARRYRVLLAGTVVIGALAANSLVGAVRPVEQTHPGASVMLDDVLHLYSPAELRTARISPPLREYLVTLATTCPPSTRDVNYTWRCANTTGRVPSVLSAHADELRGLYLGGIAERPLRYAGFRLRVFSEFLVPPPEEGRLVSWTTIDENPHGLRSEPNPVSRAREATVRAAIEHTGALFEPWVWLLSSLVVSGVAWRRRGSASHAGVVLALGLSAAAYVLGYLPVVIGYDYRFVYWPAVAVSVAVVLLLVDRRPRGEEAPTPEPEGGGLTLPPAPPAPDDRVAPAGPSGAAAPARPSSPGSTS